MHENRETSSLSAILGSPAGEGQGRTTGMNGNEESDRAIVPMNSSNKTKEQVTGVAEREEGRARTKENIGQSCTPPAQDGRGVSQGLAGVRGRFKCGLRRHASEVRAVCASCARTDLCGGAISDDRPYRDPIYCLMRI